MGSYSLDALQVLMKHFPVQKKQRVKRLILCGCGYMPVYSQVAEEQLDLGFPSIEFLPGLHFVEPDVAPNPFAVTALGSNGVMLEAQHFPAPAPAT